MNFCSNCGNSPLEYKQPIGDNRDRFVCPNCHLIHYQNPKIICGCLAFYENKLLLCKRDIEPRKGTWNLPAGFMENGETLKQGASREVWEEAQARVEIQYLHTIYNILHTDQVYFLFLAKLTEPVFGAGDETSDTKLFDLNEIPWKELSFHSNIFAIKNYIKNPKFVGIHHGDNGAYMNNI